MNIYNKSIIDCIYISVFRIVLTLRGRLCDNSSREIKEPRVGCSSRWTARRCSSLDDAHSWAGSHKHDSPATIAVAGGIPHSNRATIRRRNLIEHISDTLRRKLLKWL